MRAIVEARTGAEIRAVISNRPDAAGLEWAKARGIPTAVVDHTAHASRESFDSYDNGVVYLGYRPEGSKPS